MYTNTHLSMYRLAGKIASLTLQMHLTIQVIICTSFGQTRKILIPTNISHQIFNLTVRFTEYAHTPAYIPVVDPPEVLDRHLR